MLKKAYLEKFPVGVETFTVTTSADEEIQYNVDACKKDMMRVGITVINEEDSAIQKVFELYLKWQYDFMGEGERYEKAYKGMRNGLSLCGEYNV